MGKDYTAIKKRKLILLWLVAVAVAIVCLVVPEYFILIRENREKAYKASSVLLTEIQQIIEANEKEEANLDEFLHRNYINKAKTVAVMITDLDINIGELNELKRLANLIDVDEINLFDSSGTIYMSTRPVYEGLSFDSGEQISYFKPMLKDYNLTMCQNITKNTYGDRVMLYSMCWNEDHSMMVQVGACEDSFPNILYANQSENIIGGIPTAAGTEIILADIKTDEILSATDSENVSKKLSDLGIDLKSRDFQIQKNYKTGFDDNQIYCSIKDFNEYRMVIAQYRNVIDADVPFTVTTFAEYLILVFIVVTIILNVMYNKILEEKNWALKDQLTDLYNRREYENTLEFYSKNPLEDDLIFVSMDVNGLKRINDHYGHATGDKLLQGAADCIQNSFGKYGKTFRYGGDEFVAIIHSNEEQFEQIKICFNELLEKWSTLENIPLHISIGSVSTLELPHADIYKLAAIADQKMYRAKAAYYATHGNNRRDQDTNQENRTNQSDFTKDSEIKQNGKFLTY